MNIFSICITDCAGTQSHGDSASNKRLKLSWVYEKISKQNSRMLPYCDFNGFWS